MVAMGLQVSIREVTSSIRPLHRIALGLIANYTLVPAITVGLLCIFQPAPLISTGFLILAVCPGAPFGPLATAIAKGNVPWAISMMVVLAGLSAILSPALLSLLMKWLAIGDNLEI